MTTRRRSSSRAHTALTLAGSAPRYASVASALAEDIAEGRLAVGGRLPTEQALSALFGVSRATVREALRRLRAAGLVEAEQGVGTRVIARHPRPTYEMAVQSLADLMGYASPTELLIAERTRLVVDAALAELLGDGFGGEVLRLSGIRRPLGGGGPILSCVDMYIPFVFAVLAERPEVGRVPVYRLIEREVGLKVVDMRQDIAAIALSHQHAASLEVPAGSPGLQIVRRFYGRGGRLLEATVNIHAAAPRFSYRIRTTSPDNTP
ncbi:MAG: GntR family transcriptional regulator [Roseomonas sp.]|nr:GntR family transcriptional regulator [Roseomonas sp.]